MSDGPGLFGVCGAFDRHLLVRVVSILTGAPVPGHVALLVILYVLLLRAALPRPFSLQVTVTLMLKSRGKHGATMPYTFSSAAHFASFAATHDIVLVSKDGAKKKGVLSLTDAQSGEASDFLLLTAPFDSIDEDVNNLKRAGGNMSSGLEQATTKAMLTSSLLIAEFGELRPIADGQSVTFYDHEGKARLEVDGLVVNSAVVLVNEAKQTPTLADVSQLAPLRAMLELILSNPLEYTTKPPDCLNSMIGITKVVPVLSGYCFRPEVEAACKAAGVRCIKTNGQDYSLSSAI
jgi:hypothetical protein